MNILDSLYINNILNNKSYHLIVHEFLPYRLFLEYMLRRYHVFKYFTVKCVLSLQVKQQVSGKEYGKYSYQAKAKKVRRKNIIFQGQNILTKFTIICNDDI